MIKKGDIIIRREAKEAVVWLRQSYIITYNHLDDRYMRFVRSLYKSSLSPSLRKYDVLPDNGKSWRWAKINGTYYYSYDNIPNKKPTCYKDKLPEKTELLKIAEDEKETSLCEINKARRNEMMSTVETAVRRDDVEYFMYEMQVDKKTAEDIAVSLAWLRMIKKGVFDHLYESKEMMYEEAVSILASRKYHGLRIKSKGSLKNKLSEIPKEEQTQRAWIMSGKYGNTNASIVGKMPLIDEATGEINKFDFHQAVIYGLYMNIGGAEKKHGETVRPLLRHLL